ncbi:uncharacterized protein LOC131010266 isoform X1 [Salvia miltiorrhiza]|uniref:uncharacterized protein LOC131010266 isoform X1 n=1 Tax=Salvia miltiorrhiza TaxID=226208 RepID=UPI0025AC05D1|nr:uncharacterized protein LOC131010266 isoform X1 [Salvia miltiorrhiza]
MELKLSQSSLPTPIFNPSSFFPKHFALLSQRWKLDIQRIAGKGRFASKKNLVHVVKEGETLTSISKLYGVPVLEIADSNKEIADVNIVFEGQRLQIPSAVAGCAQLCDFEGHLLPNGSARLGFHIRQWKTQISSTMPFHQFSIAKAAGSFPILVAVVALCIVCIMGAFRIILAKNSRQKSADKSSNCARWRTALSELRDPDSLDAESAPDSDLQLQPLPDDKEQFHLEDASHGYNKLEGEYEKFLSECGMSSYGYWRGGSPQ